MKKLNFKDIFYIVYVVCIVLVAIGVLPRQLVLGAGLAASIFVLIIPVDDGTVFFIRAIPLFVALPITASFDSFNLWRIISVIIFIKWLSIDYIKSFFKFNKNQKIKNTLLLLLAVSLISVAVAPSAVLAIKRIIFLINLSLIGVVVFDLVNHRPGFRERVVKNIAVPIVLVAVVGLIQLGLTYFWNINRFADYWAGVINLNLYGHLWAETAIKANTWFAYFGDQLSLRMFANFPDSHSFPIFLLLGLPAIFAISIKKPWAQAEKGFKKMLQTRGNLWILFVPIIYLEIILTGTRGMWAASIFAVLSVFLILCLSKKGKSSKEKLNKVKYVGLFSIIFFMLFSVAYPIFASPQFLLEKESSALLARRIKSIINASELSNARRLEIWRDSVHSIIRHPLIGVGIGNFPVVVGEDLARAKAGSSAHNLYLHIAAETGIIALILSLYFIWLIFRKTYQRFKESEIAEVEIFSVASFISFAWIFAYLMTDIAIFDERAFLLFVIVAGLLI